MGKLIFLENNKKKTGYQMEEIFSMKKDYYLIIFLAKNFQQNSFS